MFCSILRNLSKIKKMRKTLTFRFIEYIWSQDNIHRWQREELWWYLSPGESHHRYVGEVVDFTGAPAVPQAEGELSTVWQNHTSSTLGSHHTRQAHSSTELRQTDTSLPSYQSDPNSISSKHWLTTILTWMWMLRSVTIVKFYKQKKKVHYILSIV